MKSSRDDSVFVKQQVGQHEQSRRNRLGEDGFSGAAWARARGVGDSAMNIIALTACDRKPLTHVLASLSICYNKKNRCRVAWQNSTITIQTRGDGGLNQGMSHETGKKWPLIGCAVIAELWDVHIRKKSIRRETRSVLA